MTLGIEGLGEQKQKVVPFKGRASSRRLGLLPATAVDGRASVRAPCTPS